jgi:hypothetical protein
LQRRDRSTRTAASVCQIAIVSESFNMILRKPNKIMLSKMWRECPGSCLMRTIAVAFPESWWPKIMSSI